MEDKVLIMLTLGLLLLAVAVLLIVAAVVGGGDSVAFEVFNLGLDIWVWGVFVAGVVTALIALGGVAVLRVGVQQIRARSREIEFLRQRVAELQQAKPKAGPVEGAEARRAGEWSEQSNESSSRPANLS